MNDDAGFFFALGMGACLIFMAVLGWYWNIGGSDAFVNNHDGIKDLVSEMRDECEARPGVLRCEWDKDELDFVPEKG